MLAFLKLEVFADDLRQKQKLYCRVIRDAAPGAERYFSEGPTDPWVARITGKDARYGFAREFVRGQKDYAQANSIGSRGVFLAYFLEDGIYEVCQRTSWKKVTRYFARAESGTLFRITREDVEAWLNAG